MTFRSDDKGEPRLADDGYSVGYAKPPKEHRFTKGRSGNPLGRPRKSAAPRTDCRSVSTGEPAKNYLLQEAYRPVIVREGEQTIELPVIQAVFRAMGVSAMKGNRFAQQMIAELVQAVEAQDRQMRLDHFASAIDYKWNWEQQIEGARERGEPEPRPIPHPDDIIVDFTTGGATVCGPMTKEQKVLWDKWINCRDSLQLEVSEAARVHKNCRSSKSKGEALKRWQHLQRLYDKANDDLPKRYRKLLVDRCWQPGSSRAGDQRRHKWPGDDPWFPV